MRKHVLWMVPAAAALVVMTAAWAQSETKAAPEEAAKSEEALALESQNDRFSYGLGVQVGTQLQRFPLDLDVEILTQAIEDTLKGNDLALSEQELRSTMQSLQQKMQQQRQQQAPQRQQQQQLTPEQKKQLQKQLQKRMQEQQQGQ